MPRVHLHGIGVGIEQVPNGFHQLFLVSPGQVAAANAVAKQHIARKRKPLVRMNQRHMVGRVTGQVGQIKMFSLPVEAGLRIQPMAGHRTLRRRQTVHLANLGQPFNHSFRQRMRVDRQLKLPVQKLHAKHMVQVRVGQQHRIGLQVAFGKKIQQRLFFLGRLAAGVQQQASTIGVTQHIRILRKRIKRKVVDFQHAVEFGQR